MFLYYSGAKYDNVPTKDIVANSYLILSSLLYLY